MPRYAYLLMLIITTLLSACVCQHRPGPGAKLINASVCERLGDDYIYLVKVPITKCNPLDFYITNIPSGAWNVSIEIDLPYSEDIFMKQFSIPEEWRVNMRVKECDEKTIIL